MLDIFTNLVDTVLGITLTEFLLLTIIILIWGKKKNV